MERFWNAKLSKDKTVAAIIFSVLLILACLYYLTHIPRIAGPGIIIFIIGLPIFLYALIQRVSLLRSPLMTDDFLTIRKEGISGPYFWLSWDKIKKVEYYVRKTRTYKLMPMYEPFLLITLNNVHASEYVSNIPFIFRNEFFKIKGFQDPSLFAVNLKLITRDPYTIFQVAEKFHSAYTAALKH